MKEKKKILLVGCKNWAKSVVYILKEKYDIITAGEEPECNIFLPLNPDSDWKEKINDIKNLDGLVNIGKIAELNGLIETPANKWKNIVNENLQIIYKSIKVFSGSLNSWGSIVNLLEIGQMEGLGGALIYDAFKKESEVVTKSLAYQLAEQKIRVNSIRAGYTDTEENTNAAESKLKEIYLKNAEKVIPMRSINKIDDIVNLIVFLLNEESRLITGNVINLDGGVSTKG